MERDRAAGQEFLKHRLYNNSSIFYIIIPKRIMVKDPLAVKFPPARLKNQLAEHLCVLILIYIYGT